MYNPSIDGKYASLTLGTVLATLGLEVFNHFCSRGPAESRHHRSVRWPMALGLTCPYHNFQQFTFTYNRPVPSGPTAQQRPPYSESDTQKLVVSKNAAIE